MKPFKRVGSLVGAAFFFFSIVGCQQGKKTTADTSDKPKTTKEMLTDEADGANWASDGRTYSEDHYSPLDQINQSNVKNLGLQWYKDIEVGPTSVAAPLAVNGVLYTAFGFSILSAVDAATGKELWTYDPKVVDVAGDRLQLAWGIRGLAYDDGKVIVGTQDGRLLAVDAKNGKLIWEVKTTLSDNDGRYITGAPKVFNGKVIIGHGGADFARVRGYVTAYDVNNGKQLWRFYTVPGNPADGFENKAMEMAAKTWKGDWWKWGGGGTVWNAITYDPELNQIYLGTGNGSPWNIDVRSPGGGDNLFLCSVVALNADNGEYKWHYQTNPAETWDYNAAMDMELTTFKVDGQDRKVLMTAPKNGFYYVIDRTNGKLISAKNYVETGWASSIDIKTGRPVIKPESYSKIKNGGLFLSPGSLGAHNWYAMSYSPKSQLVYIPVQHEGAYYSEKGIDVKTWQRPSHKGYSNTAFETPVLKGFPQMSNKPLGELMAWNPQTQKQVWSVPRLAIGNGGVMTTAGDLVFQGTAEGYVEVYDTKEGKKLWSFDAQNGILSHPITYLVKGVQYVTIVTGYSNGPSTLGPDAAKLGWDYRSQKRRILTFALNGKASLPAKTPPVDLPIQDPPDFKLDSVQVQKGGMLYGGNNCTLCHGAGAMAGGNAPDLRKSAIPLDFATFKGVVHDGMLKPKGMPQFSYLSDDDLKAIVQYIRYQARASKKK
ncbi:quinohemoprotein ethanol dehydrogenase [bacterium A37T11]|nr:quinohemoprotein ethanol dehydrogenase [bacterium A37T11]